MALAPALLQPHDWRVAVAQGSGLDGLSYASYLLDGNTSQVQADPSYFGFPTNAGNTATFATDGNGNLYFYHANYTAAAAQQDTIASLGLSAGALAALETRMRAVLTNSGKDAKAFLASRPLGSWLIIAIGAAVLAAGIALTIAGFAAIEITGPVGTILAAQFGTLLIRAGIVILLAGIAYAAFYPDTTQSFVTANGGHCWDQTSILGSTTTCVDPTGNITTKNTAPSFDWTGLAIGVGAIAAVGIGGYVAFKVVQSHYAKRGSGYSGPSFWQRFRGIPAPPPPPYPV